ncbi:MAG: hypothetical protein Q8L29_03630 [archaeon]|nr:hypothetical protein [archaeon]
MRIKIPEKFMGKLVKGSIERGLANAVKGPVQVTPDKVIVPSQIPTAFNGSDYVLITPNNQNSPIYIAKELSLKGANWGDTHSELHKQSLFMPNPRLFMDYFLNVKNAAAVNAPLYDGNRVQLAQSEVNELWDYLSSTNRPKGNCWTWLDAKYKQDAWFMESGRVGASAIPVPLSPHLVKDGLADLAFNDEGLATTESANRGYVQGENIYFYHPRENCVARFGAISNWAYLGCYGDPTDSLTSLGVFACAEGATAQKT